MSYEEELFLQTNDGIRPDNILEHSNKMKYIEIKLGSMDCMMLFYDYWGPRVNHPGQLLANDNQPLLTEKQELLTRWT